MSQKTEIALLFVLIFSACEYGERIFGEIVSSQDRISGFIGTNNNCTCSRRPRVVGDCEHSNDQVLEPCDCNTCLERITISGEKLREEYIVKSDGEIRFSFDVRLPVGTILDARVVGCGRDIEFGLLVAFSDELDVEFDEESGKAIWNSTGGQFAEITEIYVPEGITCRHEDSGSYTLKGSGTDFFISTYNAIQYIEDISIYRISSGRRTYN